MNETNMTFLQALQANWLLFVAALVVALLLALWLFGRATRTKARDRRPDVLDEGAAPAQRNQALIDTPPAAAMAPPPIVPPTIVPPASAATMVGLGEIVAHGAQKEVQAAEPQETPVPAASEPASAPIEAVPMAAPASSADGDDLRKIKGIGPKLMATLHALGVTRYSQIAGWTDDDLDALDAQLGAFAGRPRRDSWVEQARLLSGGDTADYESKFGKL